jgi:hypothetical protein
VSKLAPFTAGTILDVLRTTAEAAADPCLGGKCGTYWYVLDEDDLDRCGVFLQMNALSAISNLLIEEATAPVVRPPPSPEEEDESDEEEEGAAVVGEKVMVEMMGDDSSEDSESEQLENDKGAGQSLLNGLSLPLLVVDGIKLAKV